MVFLGTPEFAVPSLEAVHRLHDAGQVQLVGAITQPDRPGHRGAITAPPVKDVASRYVGVELLQPAALRGDAMRRVLDLRPDLLVWAAYGNRVPAELIAAVAGRALNVHPSLLPRHRGAAPVAHAILAGDTETGVTLMEGTAEMDAGPIVAQQRVRIEPHETAGELEARLAIVGAAVLERDLPRYAAGEIIPRPQDPMGATWAPKLEPADGELDFSLTADDLARRVRAFTPDPGAFTAFRGRRIGVLRASVEDGPRAQLGILDVRDSVPRVATGAGWLRLDEVRPAGKRAMSGAAWARGLRDVAGARLPS